MDNLRYYLFIFLLFLVEFSKGQAVIHGIVRDMEEKHALPLVNIYSGDKKKLLSSTNHDGTFRITLAKTDEEVQDSLYFSLLGYKSAKVAVEKWRNQEKVEVFLQEEIFPLKGADVISRSFIERSYGLKKRGFPLHFTDGIFEGDSLFEIAQELNLGGQAKRITSLNLYVNNARVDSAALEINFYAADGNKPGKKLLPKHIPVKLPVKKGWLKINLLPYAIYLKEKVIASIRFLPVEPAQHQGAPFSYEVKLGGKTRSFYRRAADSNWNTPPHHYCLFVNALTDPRTEELAEEEPSLPAFTLYAKAIADSFSIFVQQPRRIKKGDRFPTIYLLDGNAYFDQVAQLLRDKKMAEQVVLVGIGYRDAYVMDSLRVRDYTFPKDNEVLGSGGGEAFSHFLKEELIPQIAKRYPVDTSSNRILMGHSFGGYYVLYALFSSLAHQGEPDLFDYYVSASPSVHYHNDYILKEIARSDKTLFGQQDGQGVWVTMGDKEVLEHDALQAEPWTYRVYPHTEHMGTAIPTFEDFLDFFSKTYYR